MSEEKIAKGEYDVFLCYKNEDKREVKKLGNQLKDWGIAPWLDMWDIPPGRLWQREIEKQIETIPSAAVFVGQIGIGPWQQMEIDAFLREFVNRGCPVIPALLPNAPDKPKLPLFLTGMQWVDFRITDPNPLQRLIWGITGKRI